MLTQPLVSVIIIFYNAEKYFHETIKSVLNQSWQDFELLLVDDGSSDTSTKIAQSYANQYSHKIRYLEHTNHLNLGMSITRNLGISSAQGKYIVFLDADDIWFPDTLEEQVKTIESYPEVAMVYGGVEYWFSWTGEKHHQKKDRKRYPSLPFNTVVEPPKLFSVILQKRFTPTGASIYRKKFVEEINGYENAFKDSHEDQAFFIKLSLRFETLAVHKCWLRYRQHSLSTCATYKRRGKVYQNRQTFLKWVKQYLIQEKNQNWRVWLAFYKELFKSFNLTTYELANQPTFRWRIWYLAKLTIKPFLSASIYQRFVYTVEKGR